MGFTRILISLILISAILWFLLFPAWPQWVSYHLFADKRIILTLPNFWNVISNVPFIFVGFLGLSRLYVYKKFMNLAEIIIFGWLSIDFIMIGLGSGYYHLQPDNFGLMLDRMPIALYMALLLTLTIIERCADNKLALLLIIPFNFLAIFSVYYWYITELLHVGDLRLYALFQWYCFSILILVLLYFPHHYPPLKRYVAIFVFYMLAKFCEMLDYPIYNLLGISGHTLKHIFAAIATYYTVLMISDKSRN